MALHSDERPGEDFTGDKVVDAVEEPLEISEAEEAHVKELMNWVKKVEDQKWPDNKTIAEVCLENRKYVRGAQHSDGGTGLVRANLIQSNIRKAVNRTYARNPEISIVPTEAVDSAEYAKFRALGKTSEIVVNHFLKKARIKQRAKQALRAAKTCRIGWIKVGLQRRLETDVFIKKRINDIQDNLQTLERFKLEATDPQFNEVEQGKLRAGLLQRQQLLDSLEKEVEVLIAEGITLDLIKTEHMLIDVTQVEDLDDYIQAGKIGQKFLLDSKTALEKFKDKAKHLSLWGPIDKENAGQPQEHKDRASEKSSQTVHCYEIWDRKTLKVYTIGKGYDGYLRDPITPQLEVGEQWYPYFPLAIGRVDGQFWPLADVELLKELQDEVSASLTKFKEHRQKAIPFTLFNKGTVSEAEMKLTKQPQGFEFIGITGQPERPLKDLLFHVEHNPIDPQVYDTAHLEKKMEQVTASEASSQPKSNRSKTLGEAKILTQDQQVDSTSDQDEIEEWYKELSTYVWQILLKVLTPQQVQEIAGQEAQWPEAEISLPKIYNQLRLEVKPGSSGKPNKIKETETLTTVMPIAREMIEGIAKLQAEGQDEIAETMKIVLQEFLRRADERFDVAEFFPQDGNEEERKEERREQQKKEQESIAEMGELEKGLKEAEIGAKVAEAKKNSALADAALRPQDAQQPEDKTFDVAKLAEDSRLKERDMELGAATKVQISRDNIISDQKLKQQELDSNERVAQIEAAADIRKAEIQSDMKDKEIAANKEMKADELATQEKTAKISAESSEKQSSDKATEKTTKELSSVVEQAKSAKGDEALGSIIKGLEAVIKTIGGAKRITFNSEGKPTGIEPGKPDKRTIN